MDVISWTNVSIQQPISFSTQVSIYFLQSPYSHNLFNRNATLEYVSKSRKHILPIRSAPMLLHLPPYSPQICCSGQLLTVLEENEVDLDGDHDEEDEYTLRLACEHKPIFTMHQKEGEVNIKRLRWTDVGENLEVAQKKLIAELPQKLSGRNKAVMKHIICLTENDDPTELVMKWVKIMKPKRVDWLAMLKHMREMKHPLFFKVTEIAMCEESFEANIRDYTKLIDAYAREDHLEDAERVLQAMEEKGFICDAITFTVLIWMYSKAGNIGRSRELLYEMRLFGIQLDEKAYGSMIMAYVRAGMPEAGESLMREMESNGITAGKEVYKSLMKAFARQGRVDGAQRIFDAMQFAGIMPNLNSCTVLVAAYGHAGYTDQARNVYENMMKAGHMPDDRCTSIMIAAYEKKNLVSKALTLLVDLERDDFKPGTEMLPVLIDWLGNLGLVEEAEQLFDEISGRENVSSKVHVSLCNMYARAGLQEKALNTLGILQNTCQTLNADGFERLIHGLLAGDLVDEAKKMHEQMQIQGLVPKSSLEWHQPLGKR